jgi:nucleotide-binding universal stress UspA family protein
MVGIDENDYSDIALRWMLDELVDDGDHIICLRVVDKDSKIASDKNVERREYKKAANELMERIKKTNDENRSISITLEFAVGKVHSTFQSMVRWTPFYEEHVERSGLTSDLQIQMYEPAMLIVGTRGRSLGGFQGLVGNRNSFSKWCLQSSPIPVVVVRPTEKRIKKKGKRAQDPTRQDYARILKESGLTQHETAHRTKSDSLEVSNAPDEEAHAVAAALGLPARFDPTIKPYLEGSKPLQKVDSGKSDATAATSLSPDSRPVSPTAVLKSPKSAQLESPAISGDEAEDSEEDDEEEGEFEAVPGHTLLGNEPEDAKKQKLHAMEQGEAGALLLGRKASIGSADSSGSGGGVAPIDDEEDEDEEVEVVTPTPDK